MLVGNLLWLPAILEFPPWQPTTSVATAGVAFCLNQLAPGLHYSPIISKLGKVPWALTTVRSWVRSKVASSNLRMRCLGWLLGTRMLNPVHLASLRSWGPFLAPLLMQERPRSQRLVAIAHKSLAGVCSLQVLWEVPWRPHGAVKIAIAWNFMKIRVPQLRLYKDVPLLEGPRLPWSSFERGNVQLRNELAFQGTSSWTLIFPNSLVIGWHKLGVGWLLLRQILTLKVLDEACMWPLKCNHLQCRTFRWSGCGRILAWIIGKLWLLGLKPFSDIRALISLPLGTLRLGCVSWLGRLLPELKICGWSLKDSTLMRLGSWNLCCIRLDFWRPMTLLMLSMTLVCWSIISWKLCSNSRLRSGPLLFKRWLREVENQPLLSSGRKRLNCGPFRIWLSRSDLRLGVTIGKPNGVRHGEADATTAWPCFDFLESLARKQVATLKPVSTVQIVETLKGTPNKKGGMYFLDLWRCFLVRLWAVSFSFCIRLKPGLDGRSNSCLCMLLVCLKILNVSGPFVWRMCCIGFGAGCIRIWLILGCLVTKKWPFGTRLWKGPPVCRPCFGFVKPRFLKKKCF